MPIKTYTVQQRKDLIEKALEARYNQRKNWEEIADNLNVARSTLTEWRKIDEWKEADSKWRRLLRDQARGDSTQMLDEAVNMLYELMMTDKSGYVRYMSACKILDMNQVGNEIEESQADQQRELNDFLIQSARESISVRELLSAPVGAGGILPATIQAMNEEYKARKLAEIVDVSFKETKVTPPFLEPLDE